MPGGPVLLQLIECLENDDDTERLVPTGARRFLFPNP